MRIQIIRANGTDETVEGLPADIHRLIGAETFDVVDLHDGRVMLLDDLGWEVEDVDCGIVQTPYGAARKFIRKPIRPLKPINERATTLYWSVCVPGTTHQIAGDVAIVVDADMA